MGSRCPKHGLHIFRIQHKTVNLNKGTRPVPLILSLALFLCGLGVTHLVERELASRVQTAADLRFDDFVSERTNKIQGQLQRYVDLLPGLRGLWSVAGEPDAKMFHLYVDALHVSERFPSLANLNYSDYILTGDSAKYEGFVRKNDNNPSFSIFPKTTPNLHRLVVRFVEPSQMGYFGRDIGTNVLDESHLFGQQAASGTASTSGLPISQLKGWPGPGLGIRLAIYRGGGVPPVKDRQKLFQGSVGLFVNIHGLIHEAIPGSDWRFLSLRLRSLPWTSEQETVDRNLFSSEPLDTHSATKSRVRRFSVAEREFELVATVPEDRFLDVIGAHIKQISYTIGGFLSAGAALILYLLMSLNTRLLATVTTQTSTLSSTRRQVSELLSKQLLAEKTIAEQGEKERQEIGRELHDDLGQKLTGASLMLRSLTHANASVDERRSVAKRVSEIVEDSIHTIRALSHGLTPFGSRNHDLAAALSELCAEVSPLLTEGCHLRIAYDTELLSEVDALHLYRIAQESIANALRHSSASRVCVELRDTAGRPTLTISDNGTGIDSLPTFQEGVGSRSIRSRAELLRMSARFVRNDAGGTSVVIE